VLGFTPEEFNRELEIWRAYVKEHIPDVFPGIAEIMREQIARGGYVCVASHSFKDNILRDYAANGLPEPTLVYGWELPRELRKPNPYALNEIMRELALEPNDLLMVDDLKPGYDMAKSVGVPFAAAGWAYDVPEIRAFMQENCPLYFDTPDALYQYLFE
jgi:phosphoglycolate phosphatase/pyrophosphatase PpaX